MDAETLWQRYAKIWSSEPAVRESELQECLADEATYCDPNGPLSGRAALSDYMGGFQQSVPGGRFQISQVIAHNGRSLARWALLGADDAVLQRGASFALHDEQGRLQSISGFFPLTAPDAAQ
ncbi:nuclear transport factor 2 family protein [Pelagerythrobacter marensis]|uniref:Nuclear transport factor 2 family protein n=1 Tax=Pelagerythrobacter marensis TaxID=543877 RepID=A0ABZ2D523_9SPHN